MSGSPVVSVVIAVYQRPRILDLVLQSLANQTRTDFEVVLADDGSDEAIGHMARLWSGRLRQPIRHVWQEHRGFLERHILRSSPGQVLSGRRVMLDAGLTERLTLEDVRSRRIERPSFWWRHAKAHDLRNGIFASALYGWRGGRTRAYAILGSNFSLDREDFARVNGYDEAIVGRGMEDVNLRTRLLNAGCAIRSVSQEAIQYHCHHDAEPMPHDVETTERWRSTSESWTPRGMVKGER